MRIDRRNFVRVGAVGAAALASPSCRWIEDFYKKRLRIVIRGLVFVDQRTKAMDAHLLNAFAVGMLPHEAVLSVPSTSLDAAASTAVSATDPWDGSRLVFDLSSHSVTLDAGISTGPDLDFNNDPIGQDPPGTTDAKWKSLAHGVRLRTVCQMPSITIDSSKVTSKVTVEHGEMVGLFPKPMVGGGESLGQHARWTFNDPSTGNVIVKQALTNAFLCTVRTDQSTATFQIDGKTVVVKLPAEVWLRNLPKFGLSDPCTPPTATPCADHLHAYYTLIGCPKPPNLSVVMVTTPKTGVEPNYCPPGN
jgi:hypothetical protein